MNLFKNTIAAAALALVAVAPALAQADREPAATLGQILERLRDENRLQTQQNAQREREFQSRVAQQSQLLAEARAELQALEDEAQRLEEQFEANDTLIVALDEEFREKQGNFGEFFGVARQAAGEAASLIGNSLVSAQYPGRTGELEAISVTDRLPRREQLDQIWISYIDEMVRQREVVSFTAPVANLRGDGAVEDAEVTRVGVFSVFASGRGAPQFLRFAEVDGQNQLTPLDGTPAGSILGLADNVSSSNPDRVTGGVFDPTRGVFLGQIIKSPGFFERVDQGGVVGYIIIGMMFIGVLFGLFRLFQLMALSGAVSAQARRSEPRRNNPLGKVMLAAREAKADSPDVQTFELRVDDAVLREGSGVDYGLNIIKLLAAIAPLLGLLGTVTGMIATFQSITLFGAGDPRIMAGGISQALVTTVLGLVAAIPLLLIHTLCAAAARGVQQTLDEQAAGLIAEHASSKGRVA